MGEPRRVLVAIEGADGVGKSTVADAVAREVGACSWHHDVRPGSEWTTALAFAHARAELCDALTSGARITRGVRVGTGHERVVIADRWTLSASIRTDALEAEGNPISRALRDLRGIERVVWPRAIVILRVADDAAWSSRIVWRDNRLPTPRETAERAEYERLASRKRTVYRVVDAARPLADVVADVAAIVREVTR